MKDPIFIVELRKRCKKVEENNYNKYRMKGSEEILSKARNFIEFHSQLKSFGERTKSQTLIDYANNEIQDAISYLLKLKIPYYTIQRKCLSYINII